MSAHIGTRTCWRANTHSSTSAHICTYTYEYMHTSSHKTLTKSILTDKGVQTMTCLRHMWMRTHALRINRYRCLNANDMSVQICTMTHTHIWMRKKHTCATKNNTTKLNDTFGYFSNICAGCTNWCLWWFLWHLHDKKVLIKKKFTPFS